MYRDLFAVCVVAAATPALASPLDLVIDPTQSSVDLTIEIDLGTLGGDTDSDSSSVSGSIQLALDDFDAPSRAILGDFDAQLDDDLQFDWVPAFLSTADATLTDAAVSDAIPGTPSAPAGIGAMNEVSFVGVPVSITGILDVSYNIFLFGSGMEVVDFSTLGDVVTDITGTVVVSGGIVTLSGSFPIESSQPLIVDGNELGTVIVTGTATLVARAPVPECRADLTNDGELDFFDVSAFLQGLSSNDLCSDYNADGAWDFFDVSAFLSDLGAGCP